MSEPFRINRVVLKNYRSIAECDVELKNLTFLSGPNGSGKSNFLDALRFVADSLRTSLEHAMRERGGIGEVRRRSGGRPNNFSIQVDFTLGEFQTGYYGFRIGAVTAGGFSVQYEECRIHDSRTDLWSYFKTTESGALESSELLPAPSAPDRLHLVYASSLAVFRPAFDVLSGMGFYNLNPDVIRKPQTPDTGEMLRRDGSNLASVLDYLSRKHPYLKRRIEQYLAGIVQGLEHVKKTSLGQWETIAFTQRTLPNDKTWDFQAASMSDGTLRSLGVLVALFQKQENGAGRSLSLVGIEEPEVALHPAAARLLLDALGEAAESRQVIVTTHSPDLLDSNDIDNDCILAVQMGDDGATQIGPVDDAGRKVLRDRLYTPGELMRLNQLSPKVSIKDGPSPSDGVQAELFPDEP